MNLTNTLDLNFTDIANRIDAFYSAPPQGCILEKAHLILKWKYNLKNVTEENKDYKKAKFLYKNWDFNKLSKILDRQNWEEKYTEKTVQACCNDYLNVFK